MDPNNAQQQPVDPVVAPTSNNKKSYKIYLIALLILAIVALCFVIFSMSKTFEQKTSELTKSKSELAAANKKIENLSDPTIILNDEERKEDLGRFAAEIVMYVANNNGNYPTTEPSLFV